MVLDSVVEAIRAVREGKTVYAHANDGSYPKLTISGEKLLLDGNEIKVTEMMLRFETEEDPSWMTMQVLLELLTANPAHVFETTAGPKATAYVASEDEHTRIVQIAAPRHGAHVLTALWKRVS